jgi:predicted phosphodiesterase/biotin operon repressor
VIDQLIALARRPVSVEKVCLKLGISEKALATLIQKAQKDGYTLKIRAGNVIQGVALGQQTVPWVGNAKPGVHKIAYFTDTHFGSEHCNEAEIVDFLKFAWGQGCRTAIHTGDLLDGNKTVLLPDQLCSGFDGQIARVVKTLKKAPVFTYVGITGNHDGYFSASSGMDTGKLTDKTLNAEGIQWRHAGTCYGRANIEGANVTLWHPSGGAGTRNAVRRILNEKAESLTEDCDILVMGHLHRYVSFQAYPERVLCVAGGTFQEKLSEFANRITRPWDIGGTIISFDLDKAMKVQHASAEFYER